jgi:hypothetical protein
MNDQILAALSRIHPAQHRQVLNILNALAVEFPVPKRAHLTLVEKTPAEAGRSPGNTASVQQPY